MKAVRCHSYGPPENLIVEEVQSPQPGPVEVLISVQASGVNFFDTLSIQGKYQTQAEFPYSPGSEVAGVVKEIGENVSEFQVGDRVFGSPNYGGFAQESVIPSENVMRLPRELEFDTAAALLVTYGTSYHALFDRGTLVADETVLVLGAAGGVGIAAVQLAKAAGATVIAAASTQEKLDFCIQHGADHVINYSTEDIRARIKEITGGKGVDIAFDPVGGDYAELAIRSLAWGGRFLVIGFTAGSIPKIPLNLPLLKGASIVGVYWGAFSQKWPQRDKANFDKMIEWLESGKINPVIHQKYPLAQTPKALQDILDRNVMGKLIINPNP